MAAGAFFARQLERVGIPVMAVEPREATLAPHHFTSLLAEQLVRCDCASADPGQRRGDAIEIASNDTCTVFRNGVRVTHVEGHSVTAAPAEAYQSLLMRTRAGQPAILRGDRAEIALRCRAAGVERSFVKLLRQTGSP